jgi:hypothetical protein
MAESNSGVKDGEFNSYLLTAARLAKANILLHVHENSRDHWSFIPNIDKTEDTVVLFLNSNHFQHYKPIDEDSSENDFVLGQDTSPHARYNIHNIPFANDIIEGQWRECVDKSTPEALAMEAILEKNKSEQQKKYQQQYTQNQQYQQYTQQYQQYQQYTQQYQQYPQYTQQYQQYPQYTQQYPQYQQYQQYPQQYQQNLQSWQIQQQYPQYSYQTQCQMYSQIPHYSQSLQVNIQVC